MNVLKDVENTVFWEYTTFVIKCISLSFKNQLNSWNPLEDITLLSHLF